MASSLVAELDHFLQTSPRHGGQPRQYQPFDPRTAHIPPFQPHHQQQHAHQQHLNVAERGVDRLGRAIEAAEEEMENALWRTTEVHKSQLRQKEVELSELQRLLTSKERSIDSLRDTLATTKRTFEARLAQTESALSLKEAESVALCEEVRVAHMERDSLAAQLQRQAQAAGRELTDLREREVQLVTEARSKGDEAQRTAVALRAERQDVVRHQTEVGELRRQMELMGDELRVVRVESRAERERLETQVELLRQRLRTERAVRKACEKWLRSELKSREEMDVLLSAIREAASGKTPLALDGHSMALIGAGREPSPDHDDDLLLLEALRLTGAPQHQQQQQQQGRHHHLQGGPGSPGRRALLGGVGGAAGALRGGASHQAVVALEAQSQKVLDENRRLQGELAAARKLLTAKLMQ